VSVIVSFIQILATVLTISIVIRAIMSWIMPTDASAFTRLLLDVTEPVLRPVRRVMPPVGGLDLSPIVALVLIQLIQNLLVSLLVHQA
jgi:YggT family protein